MRYAIDLLIHALSRSAALFLIVGMTTLLLGCNEGAVTSVDDPEDTRRVDLILHDTSSVFIHPVSVDSLRVRIDQAKDAAHRVNVVVDGTLADACTELHDVRQERHGHSVEVTLLARRPKGAMCVQMIRPFRTYIDLEGKFTPGSYTLKVNDATRPFKLE